MPEFLGWLIAVPLAIVSALILLFFIAGSIMSRRIFVGEYYDETHYFKAPDGWPLAVQRYKPKRKMFVEPVVLCHGLGANRFNLDLEEWSLARYLRDRGFEVFVAELRGIGYSAKKSPRARDRFDWGFDDFVDKDIPAIVDKALEVTGADKVFWAGHSMGGMVAYASFSNPDVSKKVAGAVAIASPGNFKHMQKIGRMLPKLKWILGPFPAIHSDIWVRVWIPLAGVVSMPWSGLTYNPKYMDAQTLRKIAAYLISPISRRLILQFGRWAATGEFEYDDRDYYESLDDNDTPFLLLAGKRDYLATPSSVRAAYEKLGSTDKTYFCFGEDDDTCKFGHGDIVLSNKAKEQVYPMVADWLEGRATRAKG